MAGLKRIRGCSLALLLLCFLSLQYGALGHNRKISPSKLPNSRVLMSAQPSSPNFYNAFDTTFQNPGSTPTNTPNNKQNMDYNVDLHKENSPFSHKDGIYKALSSNNYAFYQPTYNHDENFADPTRDFKANGGKFTYPTFFPYGGEKFPPSFEEPFPNKESYGEERTSPTRQQGLYSPSSGDKPLYASPSNEKSWYTSTSPSNEQNLHSSPLSKYKANYPFNSNESPSVPKVSTFDEFTKTHPVSNYDSYFNTPTINKNIAHTSSSKQPSFPSNGHDLTYGQVQVP